jgi:hypothetical protein
MNPLNKFVKGKLEYLLGLFGDESSQNKTASYVQYVKDLDAALIGIPKGVALPLHRQIISHSMKHWSLPRATNNLISPYSRWDHPH